MTIDTLISKGANVVINHFCDSLEKAEEVLSQYKSYGDIKGGFKPGMQWLYIECNSLKFVAYYGGIINGN